MGALNATAQETSPLPGDPPYDVSSSDLPTSTATLNFSLQNCSNNAPVPGHTYASHYAMSGGSLSDLQELLGHSSAEMTRKYAHLTPGHLETKSSVVAFSWQDEQASVVSLAQYARESKSPGADNQKSESESTDNQ